jgi:hypothetical protein
MDTATLASSSTFISTQLIRAQARDANPVAAFIIGLAIILLSSVLNAAGLNLTKLDHVELVYDCVELTLMLYLGPDRYYSKSIAEEGLATATLASRNAVVHVRALAKLILSSY